MQERQAPEADGIPEAAACFVVVLQGSSPWAGVVEGVLLQLFDVAETG